MLFTEIRKRDRQGTSAVEFALVLPLIVLLLLGSIEISRAISIQHALQEASQAGCRMYSIEDKSQQDVRDMIDTAMAEAKISGYTITFHPQVKGEVDKNIEPISVSVSVPFSQVGWTSPWFLGDATISGKTIMPADLEHAELYELDPVDVGDDEELPDEKDSTDDDKDDKDKDKKDKGKKDKGKKDKGKKGKKGKK